MGPIKHWDNSLPGGPFEISGADRLKDVLTHLDGNVAWFKLKEPDGYVSGSEIFELVKSGEWKELEDSSITALIKSPNVNVWLVPAPNKLTAISTPARVYWCKNNPRHANSQPKPRCDQCAFPVLDE